ncbi:MAG: SpoVR family protein [Candidatus Spechtbacterales bacterium]|nr:SpoVR family protein [Candidatus Spechtbacterales bacterium]
MKLLNQRMKAEMERCKDVARSEGLQFDDNTLEYIVSNRDMLELKPKIMIPTLYDYWVHDVGAIRNRWIYDVYPNNPYETVINTRPAMSFYNQDNTDWFNVMIFYHVLGHIDYFQNNIYSRNTWDDDFAGQALADKRLINRIRDELDTERRWVDYVIEFSRAIDNLVGYYPELKETDKKDYPEMFGLVSERVDYYFGQFLQERYEDGQVDLNFYHKEIDRLNKFTQRLGEEEGEKAFFEDLRLRGKFPEFGDVFKKWKKKENKPMPKDIFEYLWENSSVLNDEDNLWMKDVMQVIRRTSLYFQPQMRSKIANEGWASFWHERLFIQDEHIEGHEVDYSIVNSGVTASPRVGLNPYATGMKLFEFIEELGRKGRLSREYQLLDRIEDRRNYDSGGGEAAGKEALFAARKYLNDEGLIDFLSEKDFQDFVDKNKLFIAGIRPHRDPYKWDRAEVYIKSRDGEEYRKLLKEQLYHPPNIKINEKKAYDFEVELYLDHIYEGKALVEKYIEPALRGLEFLAGGPVVLETTEYEEVYPSDWWEWHEWGYEPKHRMIRVVYICEDGYVFRDELY